MIDHINEFNSIISILIYVNIGFDDEVRTLLLLSSLLESWSVPIIVVSNSSEFSKITIEGIQDLILEEDIHRRNTSNMRGNSIGRSNQGGEDNQKNRKDIVRWNCKENDHF